MGCKGVIEVAFVYPAYKGVTSSNVSVFENPLIYPSTLKRLAFVF